MNKTTKTVLIVLGAVTVFSCTCLMGVLALGAAGASGADSSEGARAGASVSDSDLPPPDVELTGERVRWKDYSFVVPPGMSSTVYNDGYGLAVDGCTLTMLALRPAQGALDAQALAVMADFLKDKVGSFRDEYGHDRPLEFQERGVSGRGWEYVEIPPTGLVGKDGMPMAGSVRVLLVKLGAQVAPIIGVDAQLAGCLGGPSDTLYRWRRLYYSLEFPEQPQAAGNALGQQVVGSWRSGGSGALIEDTYAAEGRYKSTSGYQTQRELSGNRVLETTHGFFGDGKWVARGDRLSELPDKGGSGSTAWFRIVSMPNSTTKTGWLTKLYRLKVSFEGKPYEVDEVRVE